MMGKTRRCLLVWLFTKIKARAMREKGMSPMWSEYGPNHNCKFKSLAVLLVDEDGWNDDNILFGSDKEREKRSGFGNFKHEGDLKLWINKFWQKNKLVSTKLLTWWWTNKGNCHNLRFNWPNMATKQGSRFNWQIPTSFNYWNPFVHLVIWFSWQRQNGHWTKKKMWNKKKKLRRW